MIEDLRKLIISIKSNRTPAIIAVLIVGAVVAYKVYGIIDTVNINVNIPSITTNSTSTPATAPNTVTIIDKQDNFSISKTLYETTDVQIANIQSTPIRFNSANYIYFRINNGIQNARNVSVTVNLGGSSALMREISQPSVCSFDSETNASMQFIRCQNLQKYGYVDVLFTTNSPQYESIEVISDNQKQKHLYRYSATPDKIETDFWGVMSTVLKVISILFVILVSLLVAIKIVRKMFFEN